MRGINQRPSLFLHFNSHQGKSVVRIWLWVVGELNIRHERDVLQVIMLQKRGDDGLALRTVSQAIHRQCQLQENVVRFVSTDRAIENEPGRAFWRPYATVMHCVLNLGVSAAPYLILGQRSTNNMYNPCRLLLGQRSLLFSPAQKLALTTKFSQVLHQKSLSNGNVLNHIKVCRAIQAGNFTANSGEVVDLRMKYSINHVLYDCNDGENAIVQQFFGHMATVLTTFNDLTTNIGEFAGELMVAVVFFERHQIRVSNLTIIEDLCSAITRLCEESILDPNDPIFTGTALMKILERLKHAAYKDNANNLDQLVDNLLTFREENNCQWDLIVLPTMPNLLNAPPRKHASGTTSLPPLLRTI